MNRGWYRTRGPRKNVTATQAKQAKLRGRKRPGVTVTARVVAVKRRGAKRPLEADPAATPLFDTIRRLERLAEDRRQETLKLEARVASDEKRLAAQQAEIQRLMSMIARAEIERRVVESAVFPALESMIRKLAADLVDARLAIPSGAAGMRASAAVAAGTIIAGLGPILSALARPGGK